MVSMSHAKCLRVIGQTLQDAQVPRFKLDKRADSYRLWIAKRLFCFNPADISRLDAEAQKRRKKHAIATRPPISLPQQLRALGSLLDRIEVCAFRVVWTGGSGILDYERTNGERNHKVFTAEELRQLDLHRGLLRSGHYFLPQLESPEPTAAVTSLT